MSRCNTNFVLLAATLALAAGCDSKAVFNPMSRLFRDLDVVDAFPAVRDGASWRRQCGAGPIDGYVLDAILSSSDLVDGPGSDGTVDRDVSIRPGDVIGVAEVEGSASSDAPLSSPSAYGIEIDCIDQRLTSGDEGECAGTTPAPTLEEITWRGRGGGRRLGHELLILVDQSASTLGLVDPDTLRERPPDEAGAEIPPNLTEVASDYGRARIAVTKSLISDLNSEDRAGVLFFGEQISSQHLVVPCALAEAAGLPWEEALALCFESAHREVWNHAGGLDRALESISHGRSTLWDALAHAYGFLAQRAAARGDDGVTRQILVISDGPDTCGPSQQLGSCQTRCTETTAADFEASWQAAAGGNPSVEIPVHFIQFESPGYPGPDARQMEVACRTGGHYQFIDSESFPHEGGSVLRDALATASTRIRLALMGHWQFAVADPAFASDAPAPTGTPPGALYALRGAIELLPTSRIVRRTFRSFFDGATTSSPEPSGTLLALRKRCSGDDSCGGDAIGGPCTFVCSEETGLCPTGGDATVAPNLLSCSTEGGEAGVCCEGACTTDLCVSCL